jgi:hypothetical protein
MKSRLLICLLIIIIPLAGCTTRTSPVHPNFNIVMTYKSEDTCYVNGLYLRIEDVKEDYNPERDPYDFIRGKYYEKYGSRFIKLQIWCESKAPIWFHENDFVLIDKKGHYYYPFKLEGVVESDGSIPEQQFSIVFKIKDNAQPIKLLYRLNGNKPESYVALLLYSFNDSK